MIRRSLAFALVVATLWATTWSVAPGWAQDATPRELTHEEAIAHLNRYIELIDALWSKINHGHDPPPVYSPHIMLGNRSQRAVLFEWPPGATRSLLVLAANSPEAFRALFVCNVDVPVRYFETYLELVESGEKTCYKFLREITTQLPAMTTSTESLQKMADSVAASGENPSAVTEALGSATDDVMTETGLEDPKRLVKNRLAERTHEVCPTEAEGILR